MTDADMAPEATHNEGIENGRTTGIVLFTLHACLSSFMHDHIAGKHFIDGEPVF